MKEGEKGPSIKVLTRRKCGLADEALALELTYPPSRSGWVRLVGGSLEQGLVMGKQVEVQPIQLSRLVVEAHGSKPIQLGGLVFEARGSKSICKAVDSALIGETSLVGQPTRPISFLFEEEMEPKPIRA